MWRQEHADADLQDVPADMVMASGSGLDPHITLDNALYQLDRVAAQRARTRTAIPTRYDERSRTSWHGTPRLPWAGWPE